MAATGPDPAPTTTVERVSERELVVARTFDCPAHLAFEAWTTAALFRRWWVPRSFGATLLACELDVRVGGGYRLVFQASPEPMTFFGTYLEVVPSSRLVWTNEESGGAGAVTTVTFEERDGKTRVVLRDHYPSKEAFDEGAGSMSAMPESFEQLAELLGGLG